MGAQPIKHCERFCVFYAVVEDCSNYSKTKIPSSNIDIEILVGEILKVLGVFAFVHLR